MRYAGRSGDVRALGSGQLGDECGRCSRTLDQRPTRGSGATAYRSSAYTSLLPWQVRERRFKLVGLGRRGLEPDDVYAFLDRVAGDMAAVYAALADSRRETARIKDALRRWQSDQARAAKGERR